MNHTTECLFPTRAPHTARNTVSPLAPGALCPAPSRPLPPAAGRPRISPATMDTARRRSLAPPPHIMSIRRPSTHRVISSWVSQRNAYFASRTVASTLHS